MAPENLEQILLEWRKVLDATHGLSNQQVQRYMAYVANLLEQDLPPIIDLNHLSNMMGIKEAKLTAIIKCQNLFYRSFRIPKRSGGTRAIDVPSPDLLEAQRWVHKNILARVAVHECAHGFAQGRSIITNATIHAKQKYLLRLDIKEFFPSITQKRGIEIFLRQGYSFQVSYCLSAICFKDKVLPQGAATSPYISNIVAKRLDKRLSALADKMALRYSRYADDIFVSGSAIDQRVIVLASYIINHEGFLINPEKTRLSGPKEKKILAGISISNGALALPRKTIRDIKRDAHYILKFGYIEHMIHTGKFDPMLIERLLGRLNFWAQVEKENDVPKVIISKINKYVADLEGSLETIGSIEYPDTVDAVRQPQE